MARQGLQRVLVPVRIDDYQPSPASGKVFLMVKGKLQAQAVGAGAFCDVPGVEKRNFFHHFAHGATAKTLKASYLIVDYILA
jgi:hypothetical protein